MRCICLNRFKSWFVYSICVVNIFERTQVSRIECTNGDIHLILKDLQISICATNDENSETTAIKKIMKEEALKPLFLIRE